MYSHVIKLKQMFSEFFPKFQATVVRDDDAWRMVDTTHMFWADDALKLKRQGEYVEACKLYFDHVLRQKAITMGWAEGIFKNLAAAGDIGDAVRFGFEWYNRFSNQSFESDKLVMHLGNVIALVQGQANMPFPEYLKAISGNQSYTVDMNQTDLYTDETLRSLRANK